MAKDADNDDDSVDEIVHVPAPAEGGKWLVWFTAAATTIFGVNGLVSIPIVGARSAYVWVSGSMFVLGIAGFAIAVFVAGARALDGVGVRATSLFLAGFASPRDRTIFRVAFAATIVLGLGVALAVGTGPDAEPFVLDIPATAYGILVPIFPPAFAGVHGARYCAWPARKPRGAPGP